MNDIKIKSDKIPIIDVFVDGVNISKKITSFTLSCDALSVPILEVTIPVHEMDISLQGQVEEK